MRELVLGFDDLPILARLEYASNLVCTRAGDPGDDKFDPTLWIAGEMLWEVIKVLRTVPHVAQVRTPEA